jgi:hypothetical protein
MEEAGRRGKERREVRPQGASELRLRVGGVELAVRGASREDCLRQLAAAAEEVDREALEAEARYTLTASAARR